jgi:hypothetical protein
MQDQHTLIKGYRDLSQEEIDSMNAVKDLGNQVGELIDRLEQIGGLDQRWIATGKTDVQKGFMALIRSIAQPTTFV